ncbi:MAG: hypothetical protein J0M15_11050 [Deltaproteobacteria bacterium]|nr:hypothetical protein [Deltaproteobacteria bacterium]
MKVSSTSSTSSKLVFFAYFSLLLLFIFPNLATANNCSNLYRNFHDRAPLPSKDPVNSKIIGLENLLLEIKKLDSDFDKKSDQSDTVDEILRLQKERKQSRLNSLNSRLSKVRAAFSKPEIEESYNSNSRENFLKRKMSLERQIETKGIEISDELRQLSNNFNLHESQNGIERKSYRNERRNLINQVHAIIDSIAKETTFDGILKMMNDPQFLKNIGIERQSVIQKIILSKIKTSDSLDRPEEFYNQMLTDLKQMAAIETFDQKSIAHVFLTRIIQDKKLNDQSTSTLINRLLEVMQKIDTSYLLGSNFFYTQIVNLLQNKSWISFGVLINRTVNSFKEKPPEDSTVNAILNNLKQAQSSSFSFLKIDPINILEAAFRRIRTFHSNKEIQNSEVYSELTIPLSSSDLIKENIFENLQDPETAEFTVNYLVSRKNTTWAESYYSVVYPTISYRVESTIEFYESVLKARSQGTIDQRSLVIYGRFFQYLHKFSPLDNRVHQGNDVFYSNQQNWQNRYDQIRNFFMRNSL